MAQNDPSMVHESSSTPGDQVRDDISIDPTLTAGDSSLEQKHEAEGEIAEEDQKRITDLSRMFTAASADRRSHSHPRNPFTGADDPALDPNSGQFDPKRWARTILQLTSQDPEAYPRRTVGIAFRNLSVHGYGSSMAYQKNVFNIIFQAVDMVSNLVNRKEQKIGILKDHDGLLRSGEMLLVLGRPGSGVSTLLKTIAGQMKGLHLDPEAEFNYQGIPRKVMQRQFRGDAIYQAETDIHFPQLTVGQTLLFAALARTPRNRLPGVSRELYAMHVRDVVMAVFGLSHTINTRVGNDFIRGVSGGERKRVSIAEVALTQSPIQCWDNSTRGLDSATALEFVRTIKLSVNTFQTAAVVALYQASQQAYDVFDKVAVLYEGRQIYFGPINEAKQYFTDMGYCCPDRQTTADFLTSLTNPSERVIQPGFENSVPRTPDEFATAWKNSALRKQLMAEIAQYNEKYEIGEDYVEKFRASKQAEKSPLSSPKSPYTISVPQQVVLCIRRGFQRLRGDPSFFFVTVSGNLFISLILGSVFYNMTDTTASFTSRCILLFFAVLFNALNSSLEIFSLYTQRKIVEKHAAYAFYHPFSEALSSSICDLPSKILSTIAFNIPLYFMSNLYRSAGHVFIYLLFSFSSTLTMSMIFRTIAQSTPTIEEALTPTALFVIGLVIYTGFVLPTRNMQDWLRWINYINPLAYSYEAILANEFHGRDFPCASFVPMGPAYQNVSNIERTCSVPGATAGSTLVSGDAYIGASYRYYYSHVWRNFGIIIGYIVFFGVMYLLSAEYLPGDISKGEVLVFQRNSKWNSDLKATRDEESLAGGSEIDRRIVMDAEIPNGSNEKGIGIPRQTNIFHWNDVCYDITIKGEKRRISDRIDGWVKPGTLTALMGPSGAGKTTMLDVLASRVTTGVITGEVYVNGNLRDASFQRQVGYVQQQDIHLETTTVREALQFSAFLRQPDSVPKEEKVKYVEEIIALLEMQPYADAIVGVPGEGLNVEQRKRLTIGVELAAKPDLLLFLDEPTSGLDSQTAWAITGLLRKLSDHGQAILCTIHQPSAILFQQFDRLLLLAKGGKTVYFGDIGKSSETLINYFERHGAEPCGSDENPAEWMLGVMGAAPGSVAIRDWPETWRSSEEFAQVRQEVDRLKANKAPTANDTGLQRQYAMPFRMQLWFCTKRVFEQYWRSPSYIYAKLILCFGTALFIGLSFLQIKISILGLQHQMFAIFMLLVIFAFLAYQTMPNFIMQRTLYESRERPSKIYSWSAFMLSNIIVEIPWNSLAAVLIFLPFYYIIGMDKNAEQTHTVTERSGLFFLLVWAFMMHCGTFTTMTVAGAPNAEVGAILALLLFAMCLIFCGVIATPSSFPGFWIFMYRVSPLTYLISAMLSAGLAKTKVTCSEIEITLIQPPSGKTCAQYLSPYMQMAGGAIYNPDATANCQFCSLTNSDTFLNSVESFYGDRWRNLGFMWAYIAFNIAAAIFLYWVARVPKK